MSAVADQFDLLFKSFVISLTRTPDRLKVFREHNAQCDINFRHFIAVDGNTVSDLEVGHILAPGTFHYSRGSLGNAVSHLTLWQECAQQTGNFIVLEDDAVVRRDLKATILALLENFDDWDIILLGYNTDVPLELNFAPDIRCGTFFSARYPTTEQLSSFSSSTGSVALHRLHMTCGTCGYVLSPKGARLLMQNCFPLDNRWAHWTSMKHSFRTSTIDGVMATIYPKISAYACFGPLVMTPNDKSKSTVNS